MAKTAIKGLDYEAAVVQALTLVAHGLEDTVEPTGGVAGAIPRCKVGDAVITVNGIAGRGQSIKIVMEAKDTKLTPDKWRAELDQARKNRLASAALG